MKKRASHPVRIVRSFALALLLIALGAALGFCQEPGSKWISEYDQAAATSRTTGQPMMLVFTGKGWCQYCNRLESEVFQTAEFRSWSKHLVKYEYNVSSDAIGSLEQEPKLKLYSGLVTSYPTVIFVDPNGNPIVKSGYIAGGAKNWIEKVAPFLAKANLGNAVSTTKQQVTENVFEGKLIASNH